MVTLAHLSDGSGLTGFSANRGSGSESAPLRRGRLESGRGSEYAFVRRCGFRGRFRGRGSDAAPLRPATGGGKRNVRSASASCSDEDVNLGRDCTCVVFGVWSEVAARTVKAVLACAMVMVCWGTIAGSQA